MLTEQARCPEKVRRAGKLCGNSFGPHLSAAKPAFSSLCLQGSGSREARDLDLEGSRCYSEPAIAVAGHIKGSNVQHTSFGRSHAGEAPRALSSTE